ncbi:MAG: hypothetical protein ACFFDN_00190 [Candidatus Hodarchaeota archaeon]
MIRKIIAVLDCVALIICLLSYHIVYNAYVTSRLTTGSGNVYFFGMIAHGSFFIDTILWISIFLLIILIILIMIGKD